MLQPFETMLQRCVALKIVVAVKEVLLRHNSDLQGKSKKVRVIEGSKKIAASLGKKKFFTLQ